jgi:hypothetical protein
MCILFSLFIQHANRIFTYSECVCVCVFYSPYLFDTQISSLHILSVCVCVLFALLIRHANRIFTYSECVCVFVSVLFALLIRPANRIFSAPYYIVICGVSGSIIVFQTISFRSRFSVNKLLRFSLKLFSDTVVILKRILQDIINVSRSSCKGAH